MITKAHHWRVGLMTKTSLALLLVLAMASSFGQSNKLNLEADDAEVNTATSSGKLFGNVKLSHDKLVITGDYAEALEPAENQAKQFIIKGQPTLFNYNNADQALKLKGRSLEIVYQPGAQQIAFSEQVQLTGTSGERQFTIDSSQLMATITNGSVTKVFATGTPAIFNHQLLKENTQIEAESISWQFETGQIVMKQAKLIEQGNNFTASEIIFNTQNGELSAKGKDGERPRYQFETGKKQQNEEQGQ